MNDAEAVVAAAVLEEPQLATGPEHPPGLAHRRRRVRDRAERQGGDDRVEGAVGEGQARWRRLPGTRPGG